MRRFCLLLQAQLGLMLCFSLRECMDVTNSVSTGNKKMQQNVMIS